MTVLDAPAPPRQWSSVAPGARSWLELATQTREAAGFWGQFLQQVGRSVGARRVVLLVGEVGQPWQALAQWPAQAPAHEDDANDIAEALSRLSDDCAQATQAGDGSPLLAVRLPAAPASGAQVMALVVLGLPQDATALALLWANVLASVPAHFAKHQVARQRQSAGQVTAAAPLPQDQAVQAQAQAQVQQWQAWMALAAEVWTHRRFVRQAFELCSAVAKRTGADRVALAWRDGPALRLRAISQVEQFDAKAAAVRALESAMEEAADQPGDTVYPKAPDSHHVVHAHETYARTQGVAHLLSLPLWVDGQALGVITLERQSRAFDDDERWMLAEFGSWVAAPLALVARRDRWWGARAWAALREGLQRVWGPQHTAWKLAAVTGALVLGAAAVTPWDYRVDAKVLLRSQDVLFMPAPFDGFLSAVHVEVGETVQRGQLLAELDRRDLVLEAAMARADALRYAREAEKAEAARQFADMQITLARQAQAEARLALVQHQLDQARLVAPHDGVVVEGDLQQRLGAPVRQGDLLLKLARAQDLVLELAIDEADVHAVHAGSRGEFALVGRPDQRFDLQVEQIDPMATLSEGQSVFLAQAQAREAPPPWWRPGMGGSARLDVGERSVLWLWTHRTVRFLQRVFWW
jgi:biotin carboxyl carrier protein